MNRHEVVTRVAAKKKKIVIRWSAWQAQKGEGEGEREKSAIR